tara:strand:- start:35 stop:745 length:711 start_codon:yes stop_codon:yes gene_type:complete
MNFFNKIFKKSNTNKLPSEFRLPSEIIEDVGSRTQWRTPPNFGWLICKLNQKELDYVWKCVENKKQSMTARLAGNISASFVLEDTEDWFFKNTLSSLIYHYQEKFGVKGYPPDIVSVKSKPSVLQLSTWWVNYQKQHEFNPLHDHGGVYSFVIWLKIPTEYAEQNWDYENNSPEKSSFSFIYHNILGQINSAMFPLGKEFEGTMVFFPSKLMHVVYPFYNCEEDRISIAGNIGLLY